MSTAGWTVSDPCNDLFAALVGAVGRMEEVKKTEEASVPLKSGGKYTYTYATLADAVQAIRPIAAEHGLAIMQSAHGGPDEVSVTTLVIHTSGQWLSFDPLVLRGGSPQEAGSAISYARRYSLLPAFGIATEDDDGQKATEGHRKREEKAAAPPPPPPEKADRATQGYITGWVTALQGRTGEAIDMFKKDWRKVSPDTWQPAKMDADVADAVCAVIDKHKDWLLAEHPDLPGVPARYTPGQEPFG